jgi:hypothetical protein
VYDPSWTVAYGLSLLGLSPDVNAGTMLANLSGVNFKLFKNISTAFGNLLKKLIP